MGYYQFITENEPGRFTDHWCIYIFCITGTAGGSGTGRGGDYWFNVDEETGIISTARRIDREELCPRAVDCFVKFDVTVQPIQYFQIIKVTSITITVIIVIIRVVDAWNSLSNNVVLSSSVGIFTKRLRTVNLDRFVTIL